VPVDTTSNIIRCLSIAMATDGTAVGSSPKGAILAWTRLTPGVGPLVYVQRIDATGAPQWGTNGITVCNVVSQQSVPAIVATGGGGAIVEWDDQRSGVASFGQHVGTGSAWNPAGIQISSVGPGGPVPTCVVSDNSGGAFSFFPAYFLTGLYAQRATGSGSLPWSPDGLKMAQHPANLANPQSVSDGATGAIVAWNDARGGNVDSTHIYVQRVDSSGVASWNSDGLPACVAQGIQTVGGIVSDGSGGAIVVWSDSRNGNQDIYAQHVSGSGAIVAADSRPPDRFRALPAVPNPTSDATTLRFELPSETRVSAAIFNVQGRRVRDLLESRDLPAGVQTLRWDGRGERGERLPGGVYLFEVDEGGRTSRAKVLLVGESRK
jgi:hypothetical protein